MAFMLNSAAGVQRSLQGRNQMLDNWAHVEITQKNQCYISNWRSTTGDKYRLGIVHGMFLAREREVAAALAADPENFGQPMAGASPRLLALSHGGDNLSAILFEGAGEWAKDAVRDGWRISCEMCEWPWKDHVYFPGDDGFDNSLLEEYVSHINAKIDVAAAQEKARVRDRVQCEHGKRALWAETFPEIDDGEYVGEAEHWSTAMLSAKDSVGGSMRLELKLAGEQRLKVRAFFQREKRAGRHNGTAQYEWRILEKWAKAASVDLAPIPSMSLHELVWALHKATFKKRVLFTCATRSVLAVQCSFSITSGSKSPRRSRTSCRSRPRRNSDNLSCARQRIYVASFQRPSRPSHVASEPGIARRMLALNEEREPMRRCTP
jgi:hypothetical protein